ncbi:MAG: putative sterol desaturase [Myxococcaceae bacterium]|nr:putative sterol desaturase [Myxococcaceae bacterium]
MQQLFLLVSATLAFDAVLIALLSWAYYAPRFAGRRISQSPSMREPWKKRLRVMSTTSALSLSAVYGGSYLFFDGLVAAGTTSAWMVLWETIKVLLVYDFAYYFLHRLMHVKKVMRWVHSVHHRARNPSALESFYLDPIELFAGLLLMFASTWLVGPVHVASFGLVFFVYSTLNILVHSGLEARSLLLAPVDFLARKHHLHHSADFGKNYASLTPLPDLLFGTAG